MGNKALRPVSKLELQIWFRMSVHSGQGAHKMFNGTIANVVLTPENREIININKLTSTTKPTVPFLPLVLAPSCLDTLYKNTFYESELKLVPYTNFRPDFLMDLVMRSNIPLVQRQKQIPRRGVVQIIEPRDESSLMIRSLRSVLSDFPCLNRIHDCCH